MSAWIASGNRKLNNAQNLSLNIEAITHSVVVGLSMGENQFIISDPGEEQVKLLLPDRPLH